MTTKQFTPDLKLKAVNYCHKIKNYVKVCEKQRGGTCYGSGVGANSYNTRELKLFPYKTS